MAAFRIRRILASDNLRPADLTDAAWERISACFCCGAAMETSCVLATPGMDIRIGTCPSCGYTGYLDRPTASWIAAFYDRRWDQARTTRAEDIRPFGPSPMLRLARELGVPTDARIFEVGTGYGQVLKQFRDAGYTTLAGLEHAPHRAALAATHAGARVSHGVFGDPAMTAAALVEGGPYDLVFSKSVMEHAVDPEAFFGAAAALLRDGGRFFVAVPNVLHEPTPVTLFFLPHLHGFTVAALHALAARHGFSVERTEELGIGIYLAVRKIGSAASAAPPRPWPALLRTKWERELRTDRLSTGEHLLWCSMKDGTHGDVRRLPRGVARSGLVAAALASAFTPRAWPVRRVLFGATRRTIAMLTEPWSGPPPDVLTVGLPTRELLVK